MESSKINFLHRHLTRHQLIAMKSRDTFYNFLSGQVLSVNPLIVKFANGSFKVYLHDRAARPVLANGDKIHLFAQPMFQMGGQLAWFGNGIIITAEEFKAYQKMIYPYINKIWELEDDRRNPAKND